MGLALGAEKHEGSGGHCKLKEAEGQRRPDCAQPASGRRTVVALSLSGQPRKPGFGHLELAAWVCQRHEPGASAGCLAADTAVFSHGSGGVLHASFADLSLLAFCGTDVIRGACKGVHLEPRVDRMFPDPNHGSTRVLLPSFWLEDDRCCCLGHQGEEGGDEKGSNKGLLFQWGPKRQYLFRRLFGCTIRPFAFS